ncbi:DUF1014-domain-containing protein [Xylariaceae sp. FL1272]|nr:DUF1014-domain-containing protein [Xylariaceae sp. FL1272]
MGGKKGPAEGSKKAAGQARKADQALAKAAAEEAKRAAAEDKEWQKGAKSNNKKEADAEKKAEQARKKAERDALLADEEKNTPGRAQPRNKKTAEKKTNNRGLDLSQLSLDDNKEKEASASGIDNILALTGMFNPKESIKLMKHPERKVEAAFKAFHERREKEIKTEQPGLRHSQRQQQIKEEFKKSPENPLRQASIAYNATAEEKEAALQAEKEKLEAAFTK